MKKQTIELLRSPLSGGGLEIEIFERSHDGVHIESGRLIDRKAGAWFRLEDGIAELLPTEYQNVERRKAFMARFDLQDTIPDVDSLRPNALAVEQIAFFSEHRDRYENDVVHSPFYDVFDAVNLGAWLSTQDLNGGRILEVGAGTGRQTLPLAESGGQVLACDLSEDMLRLARQKASQAGLIDRVEFIAAVAEQLPVIDSAFDAGVIFGSMHHFMQPSASLTEIGRTLRPGASFYLLEPHATPVRFVFDWLMRQWKLWDEEAAEDPLFRSEQFEAWLVSAGFHAKIGYSTYLPPHMFYILRGGIGRAVLGGTDALFSRLPGISRLAGVITAQAVKL